MLSNMCNEIILRRPIYPDPLRLTKCFHAPEERHSYNPNLYEYTAAVRNIQTTSPFANMGSEADFSLSFTFSR